MDRHVWEFGRCAQGFASGARSAEWIDGGCGRAGWDVVNGSGIKDGRDK